MTKKFANLKLNVKFTILIVLLVVVPIILLTLVLFSNMEQSTVDEKVGYVQTASSKTYSEIQGCIESINMGTRFFQNDTDLKRYLTKVLGNENILDEELLQFYATNVAYMERMIENNPYLYQIRVFVDSYQMQEMSPIIFSRNRMWSLPWSSDQPIVGWKFDYTDEFDAASILGSSDTDKLLEDESEDAADNTNGGSSGEETGTSVGTSLGETGVSEKTYDEVTEEIEESAEPVLSDDILNITNNLKEQNEEKTDVKVAALVSYVSNASMGVLATIEVSMTMETLFPGLYRSQEGEVSCFINSKGTRYYGTGNSEDIDIYVDNILSHVLESTTESVYYTEINGKHVVVSYLTFDEFDGTYITVYDMTDAIAEVHEQRNFFALAMFLVVILLIRLIGLIVKRLLGHFYNVLGSIREVQKGDLDVVLSVESEDEMGELASQINKMLERIKLLMSDNISRELLAKNSEIRALQNQINAHFIYNVLESIKMMAEIDEEYEISDAITNLGSLLRYSMRWTSGTVSIAEEVDYIKKYLKLINLRFDYEIYLSLNIPITMMHVQIPKMSLQPIVENAIYHGIEQMATDTNIYIKGLVDKDDCIIEITDAGKGMSEEQLAELYRKIAGEVETSGGSGNGIGLKNVQDRLKMYFGDKYGIEISSKLGCYTKVQLRVPYANTILQPQRDLEGEFIREIITPTKIK